MNKRELIEKLAPYPDEMPIVLVTDFIGEWNIAANLHASALVEECDGQIRIISKF